LAHDVRHPANRAPPDHLLRAGIELRSACELHLAAMRKDGEPIPKPSTQSDYLELAG